MIPPETPLLNFKQILLRISERVSGIFLYWKDFKRNPLNKSEHPRISEFLLIPYFFGNGTAGPFSCTPLLPGHKLRAVPKLENTHSGLRNQHPASFPVCLWPMFPPGLIRSIFAKVFHCSGLVLLVRGLVSMGPELRKIPCLHCA